MANGHESWPFLNESGRWKKTNVEELLAEDRWSGRIDFTIEARDPDLVGVRMPVMVVRAEVRGEAAVLKP